MRILLAGILLLATSTAFAKKITIEISDGDEGFWSCSVKPFTESYEATGKSKAEATYAAQQKCQASNAEMHCRDVKCEGEGGKKAGWICKLSPFTENYEAFAPTKAEATYKVSQKCKAKNDEMHCQRADCSKIE